MSTTVYYVVEYQGRVPGATRSPSEEAEDRMLRAQGLTPTRQRGPGVGVGVAKFFERGHADAEVERRARGSRSDYEVEEREEKLEDQHPAHRALVG